jgi:hypothetical protein
VKRPLKPLKPRDLESVEPMRRRARRLYSVAYGCILHPIIPPYYTTITRRCERRGWREEQAFIRRIGSGAWTAIRHSCWWWWAEYENRPDRKRARRSA